MSKESWESDDDDFFHQWATMKKALLETHIDPMTVIIDFLKETKIPYVIIGGKAAAFHLRDVSPSNSGYTLASSTNDIDVMVRPDDAKMFIEQLQTSIKNRSPAEQLDEKHFSSDLVDIVLMGISKKDAFFDSLVDVHIPKVPSAFPKKSVYDRSSGLRYASKGWICHELDYSLKYHSSHDEISKALKRKARYELLECAKNKSESM